jgi:pyrroloquinoline quinone (PQQ) biosynthesis protein C
MDSAAAGPRKPKFRPAVNAVIHGTEAEITMGASRCAFEFAASEAPGVSRLFARLATGGLTTGDLQRDSPEIAEQIPALLADFDRLRLLVESDLRPAEGTRSGIQLYREVLRLADRVAARQAKSAFYAALTEGRASRQQLVGYGLEYFWIVKAAPGLIGPALATAHSAEERALIQDFLKSELGHDRFLGEALMAVGLTLAELEAHQPLPATFALGASLGVYARQHPLSFKAGLFLFERAQPAFIDAFDARCRALGLPEAFYLPLREHADLNSEYDHADISRSLMMLEHAVDAENCTVVKRHVSLLLETMIQQEEQILSYYAQPRERIARIFA